MVKSQVGFNLWSRETLLLGNNLVLVVAASMILLGTLYPLVLDALSGAKLSVGPPYFNALFIPLMGLLMVVMAVGVLVRWKDTPVKWLAGMLMPVLLGSVALALWVALRSRKVRFKHGMQLLKILGKRFQGGVEVLDIRQRSACIQGPAQQEGGEAGSHAPSGHFWALVVGDRFAVSSASASGGGSGQRR